VLVQLAVDEGERFGHPGDVPDLGPIRGKLSSIHPGDILVPPVLRAGGGGLALCPWPRLRPCRTLEQGEHKRLVRGVLIHELRARWVRGSPRGYLLTRGCRLEVDGRSGDVPLLTVYFGTPSMFITFWFGFDYGTNPPLGTLII
jgi:hypothetical protein